MLLVQQPQHPPSSALMMPPHKQYSSSANFHRRNPSAPAAVVVQVAPTRTPGLLALSKPIQIRPTSNPLSARHPTPRQPKAKHPQQQQQSQPQQQQQQQVQSPEIGNVNGSAKRGRGSPGKDRVARNTSKPRAGHGGRARQASPSPISFSEQASNDDAPTPKPTPATLPKVSSPAALVDSPTGRLAKRRNRGPIPFPHSISSSAIAAAAPAPSIPKERRSVSPSPMPKAKTDPVAVPPSSRKETYSVPFARSDPVKSHFHRDASGFPICDDTDSDGERPSTPTRSRAVPASSPVTWQQSSLFDPAANGPRTAPLASRSAEAKHYFPSPAPSPSPASRRPLHKRTPSVPADALYNLSFESDSEVNASLGEINLDTLFGRSIRRPRLQSSVRSTSTPNGKGIGGAFAYASSTFQNSPSPELLPPPPSFALSPKRDGSSSD